MCHCASLRVTECTKTLVPSRLTRRFTAVSSLRSQQTVSNNFRLELDFSQLYIFTKILHIKFTITIKGLFESINLEFSPLSDTETAEFDSIILGTNHAVTQHLCPWKKKMVCKVCMG